MLSLPKVWVWRTEDGFMVYDDSGERFVLVFPSPEVAGQVARETGHVGYPEPIHTSDLWRVARHLSKDGMQGYAWLDGDTMEFYRVTQIVECSCHLLIGVPA